MSRLFNFNKIQSALTGSIFLTLILLTIPQTALCQGGGAEPLDSRELKEINLLKYDLESVKVFSLTRIAITNPDIADIVSITDQEILFVGKNVGQTTVLIWDEHGKRSFIVRVFDQDLDEIKGRIEKLLIISEIEGLTLEVSKQEGKIVMKGEVPEAKATEFSNITETYGSYLLNMAEVIGLEDMVDIEAQISELSTSLTSALGFDWTKGLSYGEALPSFDGSIGDLFKIGDFSRSTALEAAVNFLIQEGKGRVLSKPRLVVRTGQQASFLVGGQIPVRVTSTTLGTGSNVVTESISYQSYGVSLSVTPTIKKGKIDITLNVTVSDIDSANAVSGNVAFTTRTASTSLYLDDKQTIVLAGLIKQNWGETVSKVAFLGEIPIIGALFRNKSISPNTATELVISLTPTILHQSRDTAEKQEMVKKRREKKLNKTDNMAGNDISQGSQQESSGGKEENVAAGNEIVSEMKSSSEDSEMDTASNKMPETEKTSKGSGNNAMKMADGDSKTKGAGSFDVYVQGIQKKIAKSISFPYEAKERGWEGTVKLTLSILPDGSLNKATVKESSGYNIFDKDALNTAEISAPYPPFPPELKMEELVVTIPIIYSQKALTDDGMCCRDQEIGKVSLIR